MDLVNLIGRDAMSRVGVILGVLCLLTVAELVLPSRARFTAISRLKGFSFWLVFSVAATVIFVVLNRLWQAVGLEPLLTLRFEAWFGWAGPAAVWLAVMAAAIFSDFFAYWYHRIQHGPLWRFHAAHHSIEDLHAVNSFGHPADEVFKFVLMFMPMSLIPVTSGSEVPLALGVFLVLQPYYAHSPIKLHLGPLRYLVADNRFHRIHHSVEPRHFGKNYGQITTIWDQIFGTAYFPAADEWPATGLADVREPRNMVDWLLLPLRYRPARQAAADAPPMAPRTGP